MIPSIAANNIKILLASVRTLNQPDSLTNHSTFNLSCSELRLEDAVSCHRGRLGHNYTTENQKASRVRL